MNSAAAGASPTGGGDGTSAWRDRKRYLWILSPLAPAAALLPSQLVLHTGMAVFWWFGPILVFGVVPILDAVAGDDGSNPPDEMYAMLSQDRFYRWCTYLFLPVMLAGLVVAAHLWSSGGLSVVDSVGLAVTVGLVSGIGINAAHELGHRAEKLERWLAKVALAPSAYGHFYTEHNRGHHVNVATWADPASARFGESLWKFLPRSIVGGMRSAWTLERYRLAYRGRTPFTVHNDVLQAWALSVLLFSTLIAFFGWSIAPYLVVQAVVAFTMLESTNYIEHYGLRRRVLPNGRHERCSPQHSWNSDRLLTNAFLFHLQRHSDHHANPGRRYQTLRSFDDAPQLPGGYSTMIVFAMIPPLWRAVIDHRVLAHCHGDLQRVNVDPRRREQLHARSRRFGGRDESGCGA